MKINYDNKAPTKFEIIEGGLAYSTKDDTLYTKDKTDAIIPIGKAHDTDWEPIQLLHGWVNYGGEFSTARYRRINGVVYVEGVIKDGSPIDADMFTLPEGFRPVSVLIFVLMSYDGPLRYYVYPNGDFATPYYVGTTGQQHRSITVSYVAA